MVDSRSLSYDVAMRLLSLRSPSKTLAVTAVAASLATAADAQSLQVNGKFGFLGEYEISATVAPETENASRQFSGPMLVKHVGICTHDGRDERDGQLRLQMLSYARVRATLLLDGHECTFNGRFSHREFGLLTCPNEATVPLRLWLKQ